jgi:hypothetical protein
MCGIVSLYLKHPKLRPKYPPAPSRTTVYTWGGQA